MKKKEKVVLAYYKTGSEEQYVVASTENTIVPTVGSYLTQKQVSDLLRQPNVTVQVKGGRS